MSLICCAAGFAQEGGIPVEALRSATFSYQTQINTIVLQAVVPELAKQFDLLRGSVKFSFRLNCEGAPHKAEGYI